MKIKKIFAGAIALTLSLSMITGCRSSSGQSSTTDSQQSTTTDEKVTIKVFSNLPDRTSGQGLIEQTLFDNYMAENENVTIEVEALDDESYKTKFKAYATSSGMPDLVNVWGQPSFLDEVVEAGVLAELNLDDYADYGFINGALDGFTKNGKLYGLARNTDIMGFYYNKALFEQYNVEVPETYDDLLEIGKTFNDNGIIPVSMDGSDKYPLSIYLNDLLQRIYGADCIDKVAEAVETGEYPEEWTEAAQMMKDAADAGLFQTGFETTDYGTAMNLFTNGEAAMFYMGSWEMSMATNEDIPEEIRNNIGVFMMPSVEGGAGTSKDICAWNGGGYSVSANSAVKDEAIKLLNYMFEPDNWSKLCWENGVCMSAQNFSDYLTGEETDLQMAFVDILNNSESITGVTYNDLGSSEYKTISEDGAVEIAIGMTGFDDYFASLTALAK